MNMKKLKTNLIVLASLISTLGVFGTSFAAGTYIAATPDSLTRNVDSSFNVVVKLSTIGNSVYAVEGTLVTDNLTCKSITLSDGLVAQSMPTCSNPYFLIGIPTGTKTDISLFKVLVSGDSVGSALVSFKNVDIIGAGVSISNSYTDGIYTITAAPAPVPVSVVTPAPIITAPTSTVATTTEVVATSSTSTETATTETTSGRGNSFVATVLETLSNIRSSTRFAVSAIIVLIVLGIGPVFLRKIEEGF